MKFIPNNIPCPNCGGSMTPRVMRCGACELEVKGTFSLNEFASLSPEDLHFLRIFVHCEGRIRDMESALGVSYPTIKAGLARLKASLEGRATENDPVAGHATSKFTAQDNAASTLTAQEASKDAARPEDKAQATEVLKDLEAGRIGYEEAIRRIRGEAREV